MRFGWKQAAIALVIVGAISVGFVLRPNAVIERAQTVLNSPWFPLLLIGL